MNGLGLKGGQASTGPHAIDEKHSTVSRQRRRRLRFKNECAVLFRDFGGFTSRGGPYWPDAMPRRIARQIARVKAKAA